MHHNRRWILSVKVNQALKSYRKQSNQTVNQAVKFLKDCWRRTVIKPCLTRKQLLVEVESCCVSALGPWEAARSRGAERIAHGAICMRYRTSTASAACEIAVRDTIHTGRLRCTHSRLFCAAVRALPTSTPAFPSASQSPSAEIPWKVTHDSVERWKSSFTSVLGIIKRHLWTGEVGKTFFLYLVLEFKLLSF